MNKKATKRALITSICSLIICFTMLLGTTFAWFTDSVVSGNNKIVAGNLDVELYHQDDALTSEEKVTDTTVLFNDVEKWEPGAMAVEKFTVKNEGSLALKFQMTLNVSNASIVGNKSLTDVLKVIVFDQDNKPLDTDIANATEVNPLSEFKFTNVLSLAPDAYDTFYVAIYWKPTPNDNDYNIKDGALHVDLGVTLLATQFTAESDSFGIDYDKDASLVKPPITTVDELKAALARKEPEITLGANLSTDASYIIDYPVKINGGGYTLNRADGFTGTIFTVKPNSSLDLSNTILDGAGATATGNLIATEGNGSIVLGSGTVLKNNKGAHAVSLATRGGGSLTINGAEIINNQSDSGAIWGGGLITLNSGKISNNSSTGSAGAIRMVGDCNFTMNGGEISNNTAADDGGAIWGYGASVYNLNGGKMENNVAGGVGGTIYTGEYSTINLSGDFEIVNNTAFESGGLRITNYTILNMTGGTISGNTSTNNAEYNGFYAWCPRLTVTGGVIADDITIAGGHKPTFGGNAVTGTVHLQTAWAHLTSDFPTLKYTFTDSNFYFIPAEGYVYTEGDESKLVCMNVGYSTYWDASTSTFRIKAN